jgi:hypothetical protein
MITEGTTVRALLVTTLLALAAAVSAGGATAENTSSGVDREDFVLPFPADVYVQAESGRLENPDDLTATDAPLYNVAGSALDVTWGEFSSATASSRVVTIGPPHASRTDALIRFDGLIPNGVYSVFYITFGPDSRNPLCETAERGIPLTSLHGDRQQPDPSSFVAGADGSATYHGRVDGALLDAKLVQLVLIYHFDGETYHPLANYGESVTQGENCRSSWGADAMRQLVIAQKWTL